MGGGTSTESIISEDQKRWIRKMLQQIDTRSDREDILQEVLTDLSKLLQDGCKIVEKVKSLVPIAKHHQLTFAQIQSDLRKLPKLTERVDKTDKKSALQKEGFLQHMLQTIHAHSVKLKDLKTSVGREQQDMQERFQKLNSCIEGQLLLMGNLNQKLKILDEQLFRRVENKLASRQSSKPEVSVDCKQVGSPQCNASKKQFEAGIESIQQENVIHENLELKRMKSQNREEIKRLEAQLETLEKEKDQLDKRLVSEQLANRQSQAKLIKLAAQKDELTCRINDQQVELDDRQRQLLRTKSQIDNAIVEMQNAASKLQATEKQLEKLTVEKLNCNDSCSRLGRELEEFRRLDNETKEELRKTNVTRATIEHEKEQLHRSMKLLQERFTQQQAEHCDTKQQVLHLQFTLSDILRLLLQEKNRNEASTFELNTKLNKLEGQFGQIQQWANQCTSDNARAVDTIRQLESILYLKQPLPEKRNCSLQATTGQVDQQVETDHVEERYNLAALQSFWTTILNVEEKKWLIESIGKQTGKIVKGLNLKMVASHHKFNTNSYHQLCNNLTNHLTLIKTGRMYCVGGFCDRPIGVHSTDPMCFIFSVTRRLCMPLKKGKRATQNDASAGPVFGGQNDLRVGETSVSSNYHVYINSFEKVELEGVPPRTIMLGDIQDALVEYQIFTVDFEE